MGIRSRTKGGLSTSRSEDGEVVEPGPGSGSVPVVRKERRAKSQTSTIYHSAGSCFPVVRPEPLLACHHNPTTPADVAPPSP